MPSRHNEKAIGLYKKYEFEALTDEPIPDPKEDGKPYFIMARRVFGPAGTRIL
jgi:tripartite-type tricarboxylate transporter receptor subunit TctC